MWAIPQIHRARPPLSLILPKSAMATTPADRRQASLVPVPGTGGGLPFIQA